MTISFYIIIGILFGILIIFYFFANKSGELSGIKSKTTGDGQFGTAKWATKAELKSNMKYIPYEPHKWRNGENLPNDEGIILGTEFRGSKLFAIVDTADFHTMFIAAPSGGKTTSLLYPNIEYSAACGMSVFVTDTKGTIAENYVPIFKSYYQMEAYVIDMRNPANSDSYNLLSLTNKYMDKYLSSGNIAFKGRAEAYAKTVGSSVININNSIKESGSNKFFYIAAEGVVSAITYLVSELCDEEQRHILSVFRICRQILEIDPSTVGKKNVAPQTYLTILYNLLPEDHIAKDLLSSAATAGEMETIASIVSTAVSQMLSFLDTEMEQLLCFDDGVDIEKFVQGKTAIIFIFDESSNTKNFIANLLVRQSYNELLKASENYPDNRLPHRIQYFLDEFGTYTAIDGVAQFFSAGRSRNIITNPFLQSLAQLDEKYGRDTAKNIKANCQNIMCGFQAPLSDDAETISKALSNQTVMSGSVSKKYGTSSSSQSSTTYQMIKKPLMSPDQIRGMKKGEWILMRTGMNPAQMKLPKLEKWNIEIDTEHPYKIPTKASRTISYADKNYIIGAVKRKYQKKTLLTEANVTEQQQSKPVKKQSKKQVISDEYL